MKTEYQCLDCGSNKVQGKAWVNLNDLTNIDFSILESGDIEDYWCLECSEHTNVDNITIYEKDDAVIYEGKVYKILKLQQEDTNNNSIYLISDDFSEIEVYAHELNYYI